ncbi:MAG: hypothetical protein GY906_24670 [bacterium]|nr:hypothetical protein [bacterium]
MTERHGIMMKTDEDHKTIDNMMRFGGSFVHALGDCFMRADATNFAKLKDAFPEYWEKYEHFGETKNGR